MLASPFCLADRVIVLTGGTGILGSALARHVAAHGAQLVLIGRNHERLARMTRELATTTSAPDPHVCDVTDVIQLREVCRAVLARHGRIDGLVNGVGGNQPGATIGPDRSVFSLDPDAFDAVLRLNLHGTVWPSLVFGEAMASARRGAIVNYSSMAATQAITRVIGYAAAKAAVDNLTRWLATELARRHGDGLRVNAIAPGFFVAEQNRRLLLNGDGTPTERGVAVLAKTPMGRFGRPDELSGAVHFLLSDASSFITGAVLPIDGGFSAFSGV